MPVNLTILQGNLTRDPELRHTQGGKAVCNIGIAHNDYKKEAHFFDVTFWGNTAENVQKYFSKGDPIIVQGELRQDRFEDKDGNNRSKVKINAMSFHFVGSKDAVAAGSSNDGGHGMSDEEIPF